MLLFAVYVEEFLDGEPAAADSHFEVAVVLELYVHFSSPKIVYARIFSHKEDFQLLRSWMVVDEVSEPLVDFVVAHWDVHADPRLQVNDVLLEAVDLHLRVLELLEELEADFVAFVYFFFHVEHVLGALVELDRHGQPLRFTYFVVFVDCLQLSLKLITFLGQELVLLVKQVIVFFEQFNFLLRR